MSQPDLFLRQPSFDGSTFDPVQDGQRLRGQLQAVTRLMSDGHWRSLSQIADGANCSEASASARLRDLRKLKFGGYTVERQRLNDGSGLHFYRVVQP